jgi:hypothetical protein
MQTHPIAGHSGLVAHSMRRGWPPSGPRARRVDLRGGKAPPVAREEQSCYPSGACATDGTTWRGSDWEGRVFCCAGQQSHAARGGACTAWLQQRLIVLFCWLMPACAFGAAHLHACSRGFRALAAPSRAQPGPPIVCQVPHKDCAPVLRYAKRGGRGWWPRDAAL